MFPSEMLVVYFATEVANRNASDETERKRQLTRLNYDPFRGVRRGFRGVRKQQLTRRLAGPCKGPVTNIFISGGQLLGGVWRQLGNRERWGVSSVLPRYNWPNRCLIACRSDGESKPEVAHFLFTAACWELLLQLRT